MTGQRGQSDTQMHREQNNASAHRDSERAAPMPGQARSADVQAWASACAMRRLAHVIVRDARATVKPVTHSHHHSCRPCVRVALSSARHEVHSHAHLGLLPWTVGLQGRPLSSCGEATVSQRSPVYLHTSRDFTSLRACAVGWHSTWPELAPVREASRGHCLMHRLKRCHRLAAKARAGQTNGVCNAIPARKRPRLGAQHFKRWQVAGCVHVNVLPSSATSLERTHAMQSGQIHAQRVIASAAAPVRPLPAAAAHARAQRARRLASGSCRTAGHAARKSAAPVLQGPPGCQRR